MWLVLVVLFINVLLGSLAARPQHHATVSYTFFRSQVIAGNVRTVTAVSDTLTGELRKPTSYGSGKRKTQVSRFGVQRPVFADDRLIDLLTSNNVTINAELPKPTPLWLRVLTSFGPTLLFIGLLVWFMRRAAAKAGGMAGMGAFGASKAKRYEPQSVPRTTFADVAGIDEVKAEVQEIVEYLLHPERFRRLGASIPRGVLLTGPPGAGKTLLARAVAGEADVPFFSIAASEFIEMIVGVGAARTRDLFEQAKKVAPAIIFIDELDAIGRARGGSMSLGGHDEREQTLNQILTEMDGFTGTEDVVVLAATNRPEILDPALLRPGRFDRVVAVNPPDQNGRRQILEVHTRSVPLGPDVDLGRLASSTPGMVGADLKNLVNEAALLATRREHAAVEEDDFTDALEKIQLGTARHVMLSLEDRTRTAYHESGHALLGVLTPGADPVRKVSIIPRGRTLGVTLQSPQNDRYSYNSAYLRGRIVGALGGRAAEELVFGDTTTGVESDLDQVTGLARQMVGRWGMSAAVGPVAVLPPAGQESPFGELNGSSQATRELVDVEVRVLIEQCYQIALATLRGHRPTLDRLAAALLEQETLNEHEVLAIATDSRAKPPAQVPIPAR
jgi:cell division protease FtsH